MTEARKGSGKLRQGLSRCFSNIDRQWPSVKFCSLGFYSAWILLVMGGAGVGSGPSGLDTGSANNLLYLSSGIPLTVVLIVCGIAGKRIEPYISRGPLVPIMALLASACTFFVVEENVTLGLAPFVAASACTGVGTAFLCLRLGHMYSTLDSKRVFFTTFASALFANLLYFMCVAVGQMVGSVLLSLFPLLSFVLALLRPENDEDLVKEDEDIVPARMLPRGFLVRCMLFVFVTTVAVGITRGIITISNEPNAMQGQATTSVFVSFLVAIALITCVAVVNGIRQFDLSRLYHPVIVIVAVVSLLAPLLGGHYLWLQGFITTVAYNILTLLLWCLFANIAGQTDLSSVRVFGLGRGASAFGNTLGQFIATALSAFAAGAGAYSPGIGVGSAVVILLVAMFVFNERTLKDALDKTFRDARGLQDGVAVTREDLWDSCCRAVADDCQLTAREREVLLLVAHGRTAGYISEELGIAYNTTKGHIKNLYAKCDVHSRQELLDLIEGKMA